MDELPRVMELNVLREEENRIYYALPVRNKDVQVGLILLQPSRNCSYFHVYIVFGGRKWRYRGSAPIFSVFLTITWRLNSTRRLEIDAACICSQVI